MLEWIEDHVIALGVTKGNITDYFRIEKRCECLPPIPTDRISGPGR